MHIGFVLCFEELIKSSERENPRDVSLMRQKKNNLPEALHGNKINRLWGDIVGLFVVLCQGASLLFGHLPNNCERQLAPHMVILPSG